MGAAQVSAIGTDPRLDRVVVSLGCVLACGEIVANVDSGQQSLNPFAVIAAMRLMPSLIA
jgi:hypothetical protein